MILLTPSLKQSYIAACDVPVPAWNYLHRGHNVTIAVDADAVTAFRRDSSGKSPLDKLEILSVDLDDLSDLLEVPLSVTPKHYGDLFRFSIFLLSLLGATAGQVLARPLRLWGERMQPVAAAIVILVGLGLGYDGVTYFFDRLVLGGH